MSEREKVLDKRLKKALKRAEELKIFEKMKVIGKKYGLD